MRRFLVYEKKIESPATHALVIGVGEYPHLIGGSGRQSSYSDGMGQLTSPPISAAAFADWLVDSYDNPQATLGTVAFLATGPVRPGRFQNAKPPSLRNVILAAQDWWKRGRRSEEDVLIFYFCGHGASEGLQMSLLLRDFGKNDAAPFAQAIDFSKFCLGMGRARARQQLFFIDACRASSDTFVGSNNSYGNPLVEPNAREFQAKEAPVFFSTLSGDYSYALPDRISVFTEALLEGLNNGGASDQEGEWQTWTGRLSDSLRFTMERHSKKHRQVPNVGNAVSFPFHRLPGPPRVPTIIECAPLAATAIAKLRYACDETGTNDERQVPEPRGWEVDLPAGIYDLFAEFPSSEYQNGRKRKALIPPYQKVRIEVKR